MKLSAIYFPILFAVGMAFSKDINDGEASYLFPSKRLGKLIEKESIIASMGNPTFSKNGRMWYLWPAEIKKLAGADSDNYFTVFQENEQGMFEGYIVECKIKPISEILKNNIPNIDAEK